MSHLRVAVVAALVFSLAACSGDKPAVSVKPLASAGTGEGVLNLVSMPGFVEEGGADPAVDWVTPFEKRTKCMVTVRNANSGQEVYDLFSDDDRAYDGALVPPEVFGRLIADGQAAPLNTKLVEPFKALDSKLRDVAKQEDDTFGVPYAWGANMLLFDPQKGAAPTSWGAVFDPADSKAYKGRIALRNSPMTLGDAAQYLKTKKRSLKIKNPYELSPAQLDAAVELLRKQRPNASVLWKDPSQAVEAFVTGSAAVGQAGAYELDVLNRGGRQIAAADPKEGNTGWLNSWMLSSSADHPNCMYQWMSWTSSPEVQQQVAAWRGVAPANAQACSLLRPGFCSSFRVGDKPYLDRLVFAKSPMKDCGGNHVECTDWSEWIAAWSMVVAG